jgi:hypothetical protein
MYFNNNSIVTLILHFSRPTYDEHKSPERQSKNIIPIPWSMITIWKDGQGHFTWSGLESNPESCVLPKASPCGICGEQSGNGNRFLSERFGFIPSVSFHNSPYSHFLHRSSALWSYQITTSLNKTLLSHFSQSPRHKQSKLMEITENLSKPIIMNFHVICYHTYLLSSGKSVPSVGLYQHQ